jgi:hypothetical protein
MTDELKKTDFSSQEIGIITERNFPMQSDGAEMLRLATKREHVKLSLLALAYSIENRS